MNEHRLLILVPQAMRRSHVGTAHRVGAPWLAAGFEATAVLLETNGEAVWETRATWEARGFPSVASGGDTSGSSGGYVAEDGEVLRDDHPTRISDRTGDAALAKQDQSLVVFRVALERLALSMSAWSADPQNRRATKQLIDTGVRLVQLCASATPMRPNAATRRRLSLDADPGCAHCARFGHWSAPVTEQPTTVSGNLPDPMLLCRWCRDMTRRHGALPSSQHHEAWRTGDQATIRRINSITKTGENHDGKRKTGSSKSGA